MLELWILLLSRKRTKRKKHWVSKTTMVWMDRRLTVTIRITGPALEHQHVSRDADSGEIHGIPNLYPRKGMQLMGSG